MKDLWTWSAVYQDGSMLSEYDDDGNEHGFREVDLDGLKAFCLMPSEPDLKAHVIQIKDKDTTPVFFRRRAIAVNSDGTEGKRSTTHCIGWRRGDLASYLFVFEDSSTLLTDDLNAV
jgi:hypothetical protein